MSQFSYDINFIKKNVQVHFRKIYEILDLPKPEHKKKKVAKEGGEGAEPAVKKIKTEDGVKME